MQNNLLPPSPETSSHLTPTSFKFKERASYEEGFEVYFEEKIKRALKELDLERIKKVEYVAKNKLKANLILTGLIIAGVALTFAFKNITALLLMAFIGWALHYSFTNGPRMELAQMFKSKIVPLVVKFFGDFKYEPKKDLSSEIELLKTSHLFNKFNQSYVEDCISGEHQGCKFSFAEIQLISHFRKFGSSSSSSTTIFKGMMLFIETENYYKGETILKKDSENNFWSGLTGQIHDMKNFKLSSARFEEIFEVYTTDEKEAKTYLTEDLLERLAKLNNLYPESAIRSVLLGNHLIIAIPYGHSEMGGKMFESLSALKLTFDMEEIHKFLAQFHEILQIVSIFSRT